MEAHFVDRILTCVDCRSEFVFTAGEQLFFYDKQFKNDPKRCKPCKSRRSGLTAAANGTGPAAAGISRTETRTECSECGVQTTVPFKPTQGRPVLCRQCFQLKGKSVPAAMTSPTVTTPAAGIVAPVVNSTLATEVPAATIPVTTIPVATPTALTNVHAALPEPAVMPATTAETVSALTAASADENGRVLSLEAAQLAVATMAAASPASSVATMADLASILPAAETVTALRGGKSNGAIPAQLVAAAQGEAAGTGVPMMIQETAEGTE